MQKVQTRRFATRAELDAALAARLEQAITAAAASGGAAIMLSGGHTPLPAYRQLAARLKRTGAVRREKLHVLFSDDRYVPRDSEASNYHASRPLLDALALPEEQVLRVRTELPLEEAARDYERRLRALLDRGVAVTLGMLGLGADGHTASLFRSEDLARARGRLALAVSRPDGLSGVSVTPDFIAHIPAPLFVIAGTGKEAAIAGLERDDPAVVAVQAVQACPRVEVWVEQAAERGA
ncbi:MAG: 6-phosphogluconolactonase [Steroidobacteraceae bacterium]